MSLVCTFASQLSLELAGRDPAVVEVVRSGTSGDWDFDPDRDHVLELDEVTACTAQSRSAVFVIGRTLDCFPPVSCADCDGLVPNHLHPADIDVESWARSYRALYVLSTDDRYQTWAETELDRPESGVNQHGRELASRLEAATNCAAYYLVQREAGTSQCPTCSRASRMSRGRVVRSICDHCRLAW